AARAAGCGGGPRQAPCGPRGQAGQRHHADRDRQQRRLPAQGHQGGAQRRGGIVVFIGTVRDNSDGREVTAIEYEAYRSMAVKSLTEISERCEAVAHRTGTLAIGETVVIIAAAGPHRAEAFQAARSCAELMKWETAIWRKEIRPDGEEWIGAPCDLAVE
ncbi:MAG TPA: molybdenum cofactor biosynthesis protein MoaE, partial [Stackebrandtia sp.]|uniref:molybdenum cofactor biosynthesis protein MoaE n=1 Tax=Stackebrandtia sp. TaxID=2023065 RepID=UPI002D4F2257